MGRRGVILSLNPGLRGAGGVLCSAGAALGVCLPLASRFSPAHAVAVVALGAVVAAAAALLGAVARAGGVARWPLPAIVVAAAVI